MTRMTAVRIEHAYEMTDGKGNVICTGESTIACVNRKGEVIEIPDDLRG